MADTEKIQHEGIIKSISEQTLEVMIVSLSACSGCHAKGACGMSDAKQKIIVAQRPEGNFAVGEKVTVTASLHNAFYSVLLAYIFPSILIIAAIFFIEKSEYSELTAAISSLFLLMLYFFALYLLKNKINKKIKFTVEKTGNY